MKSLLFGILSCLPVIVFGQFRLINTDLINADTSLLYAGIENQLVIAGQKGLSGLSVTSSNKSEVKVEANFIVIFPSTNSGFDTLRLFRGKKWLLTAVFRVSRLSDPLAQLAFTFDTTMSINRILANPYLTVKVPNNLYKVDIRTESFECTIFKKNGEKNLFSVMGNKLSEQMIAGIKNLSPHDEMVFDNIKIAAAPSFCPRALPSFKITIQ